MRHSFLWVARNPRVLWSSTSNLRRPVQQWRIARQVLATPSVRDVFWLVGGLSFHGRLGTVHAFIGTQAARTDSSPECMGHRRCRPGSLALAVGQLLDPHTLGGHQCGGQRGPDLKHNTTATFFFKPVWVSARVGLSVDFGEGLHVASLCMHSALLHLGEVGTSDSSADWDPLPVSPCAGEEHRAGLGEKVVRPARLPRQEVRYLRRTAFSVWWASFLSTRTR